MIYITGDTHSDYTRFNMEHFPEQREMTRDDYVIICGDFGGVWDGSKEELYWLKWLSEKKFTLLFADGNHENFDMLDEMPVQEWKGGKVHRVRENVIHLMRGQMFHIQGCSIFTFGGARSHDIADGILEPDDPKFKVKRRRMLEQHKLFRVNHLEWWQQEIPTAEEMEEGRRNLAAHENKVDYVVTHCAPSSVQRQIIAAAGFGMYETDALTDYLDEIRESCTYKKWFFGHYHKNQNVTDRDLLLYEQILRIW